MTVTPNVNPQMTRSFDLLKTFWIWPMLSELNLDRHWILSMFLRLVDLGSFMDSTALVDHVKRTCLSSRRHPPPQIMLDPNHGYVIPCVVVFLHGIDYGSIHAGTLFIKYVDQLSQFGSQLYGTPYTPRRHILNNKIPVELTVLCRILELVTGSYVMASAYNSTRSFHGITLPRSWILENVQKFNRLKSKYLKSHMHWYMATPFQDLLERVYSGNDTGRSNIEKLPPVTELDQTTFSTRISPSTLLMSESEILLWRDCTYWCS